MRGVPVLASDSGYYPRSDMLPLARSSRHSNLRPQFAEIMPGILSLQGMVFHYSIESCRIAPRETRADDLALQYLTPAEYERMADAEQSIEQLSKKKEELVGQALARHGTDWRSRLTSLEKACLDRGDVAEGSENVALREMFDEERQEYHDLEQRLNQARQIHTELMDVAMERRGTDQD